jgi:hypothetical protein
MHVFPSRSKAELNLGTLRFPYPFRYSGFLECCPINCKKFFLTFAPDSEIFWDEMRQTTDLLRRARGAYFEGLAEKMAWNESQRSLPKRLN